MSYYEQLIYRRLCDLYRYNRGPVSTTVLAGLLGKNDRVIRYALVRLEERHIVARKGQRGGWVPVKRQPATTAHWEPVARLQVGWQDLINSYMQRAALARM